MVWNFKSHEQDNSWNVLASGSLTIARHFAGNLLCIYETDMQGAVSIRKTVLPGMAIPMLKIRRPNARLIFNMEIAIRR